MDLFSSFQSGGATDYAGYPGQAYPNELASSAPQTMPYDQVGTIVISLLTAAALAIGIAALVIAVEARKHTRNLWPSRHDAVVSITVRFKRNEGDVFFVSSGFFVTDRGHFVTAAHAVIDNSPDSSQTPVSPGKYPRAADVRVTYTDPHRNRETIIAPADILGVDGAADVALLRIPGLRDNSYLKFEDSRKQAIGSRVTVIGDALGQNQQSASAGVLRDNIWTDPDGVDVIESVLISAPAFHGNSGSPILNDDGKVIGMFTFSIADSDQILESFGGGISSYMMSRIVGTTLSVLEERDRERNIRNHNEHVTHGRHDFTVIRRGRAHVDGDGDWVKAYVGATFAQYTALQQLIWPVENRRDRDLFGKFIAGRDAIHPNVSLNAIGANDVISHVEDTSLRDTTITAVTWFLLPEDHVSFSVNTRRGDGTYGHERRRISLQAFPMNLDYPLLSLASSAPGTVAGTIANVNSTSTTVTSSATASNNFQVVIAPALQKQPVPQRAISKKHIQFATENEVRIISPRPSPSDCPPYLI